MTEKRFYTYVLLDPRKPGPYTYGFGESTLTFSHEPFYVGKGTTNRWKMHYHTFPNTNSNKEHLIQKLNRLGFTPLHERLIDNTTEDLAFAVEEEAISTIGRKRVGQGPLMNISIGGVAGGGWSGWRHTEEFKARRRFSVGWKHTEEAKAKISAGRRGKATGERNQWYGKPIPVEIKEKMSQAKLGKKNSKEHCNNMSLSRSRINFYVKTPEGEVLQVRRLVQFCKEHNLEITQMRRTEANESTHRGYAVIGRQPLEQAA